MMKRWKDIVKVGTRYSTSIPNVHSFGCRYPRPAQLRFHLPLKVSRTYSLISLNLFDKCRSCGIKLQEVDSKAPGYKPKVEHKPYTRDEDAVFEKHLAILNQSDKSLLVNDTSEHQENTRAQKNSEQHEEQKDFEEVGPECLRCRRIKYQNEIVKEEAISNESILDKLPPDAKLIFVVNAIDVPIGVNRRYINKDTIVVVTKLDLLYSGIRGVRKFPFFVDYFKKKFGVPESQIILASNTKAWNLNMLRLMLEKTPYTYYILGDVNSGKSSMISKMMYIGNKDFRISPKVWSLKHGPGVSEVPGFTRDALSYQFGNATLVDLPGLNHLNLPDFKKFKNVFKNVKVYKHGLYKSRYKTFHDHILTIAGMIYLEPPPGLIVQYKNLINFQTFQIKNHERLADFERDFEQNRSLHNKFIIPPTTDLVTYVIPPFVGRIDLVIKQLGYIELTPTGAKNNNQLFEVHVPRELDIELRIRHPITNYISQRLLPGIDRKGNTLTKENWHKSTRVVNTYKPDEKFASVLFKKNTTQFEAVEHFTGLPYDDKTEITKENYLDYWIE